MYLNNCQPPVLKKVRFIALTPYSYGSQVDAGSPQEDHQTRNWDWDTHRYAFVLVAWHHEWASPSQLPSPSSLSCSPPSRAAHYITPPRLKSLQKSIQIRWWPFSITGWEYAPMHIPKPTSPLPACVQTTQLRGRMPSNLAKVFWSHARRWSSLVIPIRWMEPVPKWINLVMLYDFMPLVSISRFLFVQSSIEKPLLIYFMLKPCSLGISTPWKTVRLLYCYLYLATYHNPII